MIRLNRFQYFASNILITMFGFYVSFASGIFGTTRYDGWIISGTIIWYGGIVYTAAARMKHMGFTGKHLWLSVTLIPLLFFNYIIGLIYLSLRKSK